MNANEHALSNHYLSQPQVQSWLAFLSLQFNRQHQRTVLTRRQHQGPLLVQKPFYPHDDHACHVYLIHPPGGIVGGDHLELNTSVGQGAHALLTTPAAGKSYRHPERQAAFNQSLVIQNGASLDYLPQETILYNGANYKSLLEIKAHESARFIAWDIVCLGRHADKIDFEFGRLDQQVKIYHNDELLLFDRLRIQPGDAMIQAKWGLANHGVIASLWCKANKADLVNVVQGEIESDGMQAQCCVTLIN